jgi:hypothetical protein
MPSLRRQDLFGFATQTQVLDAEEEFAFTPADAILDDEEDYGGDDLSDVSLFAGADDDADAALDALDKEMGQDEDFGGRFGEIGREIGNDPSLSPIGGGQYNQELATVLLDGFQDGLESDSRIVQMLQRAGRSMSDIVAPGDLAEIASAMLADPAFGAWNSLTEEQQIGLVESSVSYAAIPGLEMSWDDAFRAAWQEGGISTMPSDVYTLFKVLFTQDGPKFVWSVLNEVPLVGAMLQKAGFTVENSDQMINMYGMSLYMIGLFKPEIYQAAARAITERGQHIIQSAQAGLMQAGGRGGMMNQGGLVIEEEALVSSIQLPEPAQTLPDQGIGMPEPPQILATGYGVAIAGALLGFFR